MYCVRCGAAWDEKVLYCVRCGLPRPEPQPVSPQPELSLPASPIRVEVLAEPEEEMLVAAPEELPGMPQGHEALEAALVLVAVVLVLGAATVLGSLY